MRALMWSLSEYYIDNLAEETKKGHRETALKGLHNGGYPPFGVYRGYPGDGSSGYQGQAGEAHKVPSDT